MTVIRTADVSFDKTEFEPLRGGNRSTNFVKIALMPRRKVIQPDYFLVKFEQGFDEMRTDETGTPRYQPASRSFSQTLRELIVDCQSRHTVTPFALS